MRKLFCLILSFVLCFPTGAALDEKTTANVNLRLIPNADRIEVGFSSAAISSEADYPAAFPSSGIPLSSTIEGNKLSGTASGWVYWKIVSSKSINILLRKSGDLSNGNDSIDLDLSVADSSMTNDGWINILNKTSGTRSTSSKMFSLSAEIEDFTASNAVGIDTYTGELTIKVEMVE